jgi:hypothetical protein
MKTRKLLIPILVVCLFGCKKEKPNTMDVIELWTTSSTTANADGAFEITLIASLPTQSLPDKREVTFSTSDGTFKDGTATTIKIKAENTTVLDGKLSAVAHLIAPINSGQVTVKAEIEGYIDSLKFTFNKVVPTKIKTYTDSFSARVNFKSILQLNSKLSSVTGGFVTKGSRVKYKDFDVSNKRALGAFRDSIVSTDINSQASAKYSPGIWPPNNFIFIVATVIDDTGNETIVRDTVRIYLLP